MSSPLLPLLPVWPRSVPTIRSQSRLQEVPLDAGQTGLHDATVRSEGVVGAQAADTAEQHLDLAEGGRGRVLRNHVAREVDADKRESTLGDGRAEDAGAGDGRVGDFVVVGDVEGVRGRGLEALEAAPSHVLDLEEGAVCDAISVCVSSDNDLFSLLPFFMEPDVKKKERLLPCMGDVKGAR